MGTKPGKTVESISLGVFIQTKSKLDHPVLVRDYNATSEPWTPEFVVNAIADVKVPVKVIIGGDYLKANIQKMTVSQYYKRLKNSDDNNETLYLSELSYDHYFPKLAKQLAEPAPIPNENFLARVMYFGKKVNSQIHYHPLGSALLCGLYGSKIVRLYPPKETSKLYKVPLRNFSKVHIKRFEGSKAVFDEQNYPEFGLAEYYECIVNPGDVLYIPIYWWHCIQNTEDVSISAVYFWTRWTRPWQYFLPSFFPPKGMRLEFVCWRVLATCLLVKGAISRTFHFLKSSVTKVA